MITKTGLGYYVRDGKIIGKYDLPIGKHPDPPEGITVVEVATIEELNLIEVAKKEVSPQVATNRMIEKKIREIAIEALKKEGKLDAEYSD